MVPGRRARPGGPRPRGTSQPRTTVPQARRRPAGIIPPGWKITRSPDCPSARPPGPWQQVTGAAAGFSAALPVGKLHTVLTVHPAAWASEVLLPPPAPTVITLQLL
eukprot:763598-Hanusia_phi.AAC.8